MLTSDDSDHLTPRGQRRDAAAAHVDTGRLYWFAHIPSPTVLGAKPRIYAGAGPTICSSVSARRGTVGQHVGRGNGPTENAFGGSEALGLIGDKLDLKGVFWDWIGSLNGNIGFVLIGVFVASWVVSAAIYRAKGYDRLAIDASPS